MESFFEEDYRILFDQIATAEKILENQCPAAMTGVTARDGQTVRLLLT